MRTNPQPVDYKTHVLIGVRPNGVMTVIADRPHVPKKADVQKEIVTARDGYVTLVLCTPTSFQQSDMETPRETDHLVLPDVGEADRRAVVWGDKRPANAS